MYFKLMNFDIIKISDNNNHGNDFYNFVNENWININDIPNDYQRWGTFQELEKNNFDKIKKLLEQINNNDENYSKIRILYNQLNNSELRSSDHDMNIIMDYIKKIKDQNSYDTLFGLMIDYDIDIGINLPINFVVQSSFKNANHCILHLVSGGLGLPDRDYYFLESKEEIRIKYCQFIKNYGLLFNIELDSTAIFNLEKQLAEKSLTQVQKRNTTLIDNLTIFNNFIISNPKLRYLYKIFEKAGKKDSVINITNPLFMNFLNQFIESVDLELWKQYFIFHFLLEFNYCLKLQIEEEYFNFYTKVLKGTDIMKPQWMRTIENLNFIVGELIGLYYVSKYFTPKSKQLALEIVNLIKEELKDYLINNDWMEQETKKKAMLKLELMRIKIGYPDIIKKNYSLLLISESNSIIQNIMLSRRFNNEFSLKSLYDNLDRDKWYMNAHAVNAYYSPNMNEIVFPAGILQEPFFSVNQNMAYNFGGFGMVIGHEITHAFDDEGSKYDAYGNLCDWWSDNDYKKYKEKTNRIKLQYDSYEIEGNKINGELTLGENIADIGGIALSFGAFKKYNICLKNKNIIKIKYDNNTFSDEQNFFINFANIWKSKARSEDVQQRILLDVHSPPIFRVNGTVRNIDDFYKVFNIKPTDKLYLKPEERVKIWS